MRRRTRRVIALAIVAATAAIAAAAMPGDLVATPPIRVIRHMVATPGSGAVLLENRSASNVTVNAITFACDSTMGLLPPGTPFTLAPNGSRNVFILCPANLPLGMQRCTFTARDVAGVPLVSFLGVCETDGMPLLSPMPASHDFGSVPVGSPSTPFTFNIQNNGGSGVTLLQLQLDDPSFQIGMPCNPDAIGCDAADVGPISGSGTPVTVYCRPLRTGSAAARLYAIGSNGLFLPTPIDLACNGTPSSGPALSIMPSPVDVGTVEQIMASASASVSLSNSGSGTLAILSAEIVDANVTGASNDWARTFSGKCATASCNLMNGEVLSVDLVFDPSQIGLRDATLLVTYNDSAQKVAAVDLRGTGRGATLELVGGQTMLDVGVVPLNTDGEVSFKLMNTGNRTLTTATAIAMPAGPPFTLPPNPITVTTSAQTTVIVRCRSATVGMYSTMIRVSAPDVVSAAIDLTVRCEVRDTLLFAMPSSLQLGEVRTGTPETSRPIMVRSAGSPIALAGASLMSANPNLALSGPTPMTTPSTVDLAIRPTVDEALTNSIAVMATSGSIQPISIPITGSVVTASYTAPDEIALGTFCVGQPTTPGVVMLSSTGSATIELRAAPRLGETPSPFEVAFASPTGYPAMLAPRRQAIVEITPKRRAAPGVVDDNLLWTTDAIPPTRTSALHAMFIDAGVAIAPTSLAFAPVAIHIDTENAQQINLRNCDDAMIHLGAPTVPSPFSMDSPRAADFPRQLMPGETTTFRVGFHPTKLGRYEEVVQISSPELAQPLLVTVSGEGVTSGSGSGDDVGDDHGVRSSFYACGGCGTNQPDGSIVMALVCLLLVRRRRTLSRYVGGDP